MLTKEGTNCNQMRPCCGNKGKRPFNGTAKPKQNKTEKEDTQAETQGKKEQRQKKQ